MKVKVDNFINENSTLIKGVLTAPLVGVVAGAKARKIKVEFKRGALFKALKWQIRSKNARKYRKKFQTCKFSHSLICFGYGDWRAFSCV